MDAPPAAPAPPPAISLWEAAAQGDVAALAAHRAAGTNLDALQPGIGTTALVAATVTGQAAAVDWLIGNGADVNARTGDGNSTLHAAAFVGNAEIAQKLLDAGIDVAAINDNGQNVWQTLATDWRTTSAVAGMFGLTLEQPVVEAGRAEVGELLAPHLEALSVQDIWTAVATGNADAVRSHLARGEDATERSDTGATLLSMAALFGYVDVAKLLLDAGADVNARNRDNGATALPAAAFLGRAAMVEALLNAGADAGLMDDNGATALTAAQLDWATTAYVAAMFQAPVGDEASVMAGKAAVVELLSGAR